MVNENIASVVRDEGFFEPIPADKVPNLANVYPNLRNPSDNGVRGIVSTIGIGYRKDLVKKPPTSWTDLWTNPEFKGKIGLYQIGNTAGDAVPADDRRRSTAARRTRSTAPSPRSRSCMPFHAGRLRAARCRPCSRAATSRWRSIDFPEIVALKKKGVPVEMVVPKEGMVAFEQSFNILQERARTRKPPTSSSTSSSSPSVQEMMAKEFYTSPTNTKSQCRPSCRPTCPVNGEAWRRSSVRLDAR